MARIKLYNVLFPDTTNPLTRELDMIRRGGRFKKQDGEWAGEGLFFHYQKAIQLAWPHIQWHRWLDKTLTAWCEYVFIGVIGPASSGKTNNFAMFPLIHYYAYSSRSTILVCSTTRERLEDRIWGEMKKLHKVAKTQFTWLPGNLIEGRQRIVTDDRSVAAEGRDFRNGVIGVPCKKGGEYVGLGDFVGIKNEWLILVGDELQLLPRAFIDSTANLLKNRNVKICGLGNPKETTDSLGILCEPAVTLGGWDGGIDQSPGTKMWETRWDKGICVQLPGSDCPNMEAKPGEPAPFPFLITREQMESDAKMWGKDDWHYTMMDEGRMPRGQGSRRVITRALCIKGGAFNPPIWRDSNITRLAFLDAAYRSVGGDRCIFGEMAFGEEADSGPPNAITPNLLVQETERPKGKIILALIEYMIVPIKPEKQPDDTILEAEDQIVDFCKTQCEARRIPPEHLFYDSGMRTSLVSAFAKRWTYKTVSIDCGGKATERKVSAEINELCCDYYSKLISEFWYSVRLIIDGGQFRGLTEDACLEGCQREFKLVSSNRIEIESKQDMKEKTGRSPDIFDGIAVGTEGARRLGFVISRLGGERRFRQRPEPWKLELEAKRKSVWHGKSLSYQRS